jgi:hypothetical protein
LQNKSIFKSIFLTLFFFPHATSLSLHLPAAALNAAVAPCAPLAPRGSDLFSAAVAHLAAIYVFKVIDQSRLQNNYNALVTKDKQNHKYFRQNHFGLIFNCKLFYLHVDAEILLTIFILASVTKARDRVGFNKQI